MNIDIVYEDNQIIVCVKPAGVPSQSDKTMDIDMVNLLKNYLHENTKKSNPYIGLVHRLDRPVEGIMVFAKTPEALKKLDEQVRDRKLKKYYLAVSDKVDSNNNVWMHLEDYLIKEQKTNLSIISNANNKLAKKAVMNYRICDVINNVEMDETLSLIEIELLTGRHHQIRVQLANAGLPLWGDTKYNDKFTQKNVLLKWTFTALHAYKLELIHPKTGKVMTFVNIPSRHPFDLFKEIENYQ